MRSLCSLLIVIGLLSTTTAFAVPVTLKCTDSSGQPVADLVVDAAAGHMQWSISKYRITQQNDRYISAQEIVPSDRVGGETWVLDRVTGRYVRAGVAILASRFSEPAPVDPKLESFTYTGVCNAPVL